MLYAVLLNKTIKEKRERNNQNQKSHERLFYPLLSGRDFIAMAPKQKEMVDELKVEWKKLWRERVNDKVRAEGIANYNYSSLFVDKGTIIHATRDFKALNFKEILQQHQIENADRFITPSPVVGGWNKFIKTKITSVKSKRDLDSRRKEHSDFNYIVKKENQQPKKGGRGWLHK